MHIKHVVIAVVTYFMCLSVAAATLQNYQGPFISLQGGYGRLLTGGLNLPYANTTVTRKNSGFAYNVALGYLYQISDHFLIGPEIGYITLPKSRHDASIMGGAVNVRSQFSSHAIEGLLDLMFLLPYKLYTVGKLGAAYVKQENVIDSTIEPTELVNENQTRLEAAFGLGYLINHNFRVNVTYYHIFGHESAAQQGSDNSGDIPKIASADAFLLGISYVF
jgi:opacity protein-like surface antigen